MYTTQHNKNCSFTHSVLIDSKWFNGGKEDSLPPKSLILLSITTHKRKTMMMNDLVSFFPEEIDMKRSSFSMAYRSVKLVNAEILEGMGPSKPEPCICLQNTYLVCMSFLRKRMQVLMEKEIILQFHYLCPIADKIWYPASEVIITYPPIIQKIQ